MYEQHFQFRSRPFNNLPVVEDFYPATSHRQAYDMARMCVTRSSGPVVLIGSVGIGKTLMLKMIGESLAEQYSVVQLEASQFQSRCDFLQSLLFELDLPYTGMGEGELRLTLLGHLKKSLTGNDGVLLLIDEADRLSVEMVDEVRMISSQMRGGKSIVQVVLAGSPRLEETLTEPRLASFNQRVATRCYLQDLSKAESTAFIKERIENAGRRLEDIFDAPAIGEIYRFSDGCPRLLNQLCDHTLLVAAGRQVQTVNELLVQEAWAEMQNLPVDRVTGQESCGDRAGTDSEQGIVEFGQLSDEGDDVSDGETRDSVEARPTVANEGVEVIASHDASSQCQGPEIATPTSGSTGENCDLFTENSHNRSGVQFDVLGVDPFAPAPPSVDADVAGGFETATSESLTTDGPTQSHEPPHSFRNDGSDRRQSDNERRLEDGNTVSSRIESLQQEQQDLLDQAVRLPETPSVEHLGHGADSVAAAFMSLGDLVDDEVEVTEKFAVPQDMGAGESPHAAATPDFDGGSLENSQVGQPVDGKYPPSIQDFQTTGNVSVDPMRWESDPLPNSSHPYARDPAENPDFISPDGNLSSENDPDFDPQQPFELDTDSTGHDATDDAYLVSGAAPIDADHDDDTALRPEADRTEEGLEIPLHPAMTAHDPFGEPFEEEELLQDAYTPFVIQQNQSSLSVTSGQLAHLQPIDEVCSTASDCKDSQLAPGAGLIEHQNVSAMGDAAPQAFVSENETPFINDTGFANDVAPDSIATAAANLEDSGEAFSSWQDQPDSAYPQAATQSSAPLIQGSEGPSVPEIDEELAALTGDFDGLADVGVVADEIQGASLLDLNDLVAHLPEDVGTHEQEPQQDEFQAPVVEQDNSQLYPGVMDASVPHETGGATGSYSTYSGQGYSESEGATDHDIVPMTTPQETPPQGPRFGGPEVHATSPQASESEVGDSDDQSSQILREIFTQQKIIREAHREKSEQGQATIGEFRQDVTPAQASEIVPSVEYPIDQHPDYQQEGRTPWQADDRDILKVNESNQIDSPQATEEPASGIFPQINTSTGSAERVDYQQLFDRLRNLPRE